MLLPLAGVLALLALEVALPHAWKHKKRSDALRSAHSQLELHDDQLISLQRQIEDAFDCGASERLNARLPMLRTFVYPSSIPTPASLSDGSERAVYSIDLGGTNIRLCRILLGAGSSASHASTHRVTLSLTMPHELLSAPTQSLFDFLGQRLADFVHSFNDYTEAAYHGSVPVGFCFSFPVEQTSLSSGNLLGWTKGYACTGGIGNDVSQMLAAGASKAGLSIDVKALVNDTVALLAAARGAGDGDCGCAFVFGSGVNGAFFYGPEDEARSSELGNHDSDSVPSHWVDCELDASSVNPGKQLFEKKVSGNYLGCVLGSLAHQCLGVDFHGTSEDVARIDGDVEEAKRWTKKSAVELQKLAQLVRRRAARLAGAAVAAAWKKSGSKAVGLEGAVAEKYVEFRRDVEQVVEQLTREGSAASNSEVARLFTVRDGAVVGAALIAAAQN